MNDEIIITKPSKYARVNIFSKVYCTWLYPMFIRSLKRDVQIQDLYKCPPEDMCETVVAKLEKNWRKELAKQSPSFMWASIKTFSGSIIIPIILVILDHCVIFNINMILLAKLLAFFAAPDKHNYLHTCLYACAMIVTIILNVSFEHPALLLSAKLAMNIRVSWCTLIYKKALRLKHSAFSKTTIGQILNLMSNDVSRLEEFCQHFAYLIAGPINIAIGVAICWQYIGWVSFIGLAILMCFIPFNGLMGRLFLKIRRKVAALTDNRIRLMNDIITGMSVIKMYAWERHFSKLIADARKKEMRQIQKSTLLKVLNKSISDISGRVMIFVILIVHIVLGGRLTAETVFISMYVYQGLQYTMTSAFPQVAALTAELYVSAKRIQTYLLLDEIEELNQFNDENGIQNNGNSGGGNGGENVPLLGHNKQHRDVNDDDTNNTNKTIIVDNLCATWDTELKWQTIKDITVSLGSGELLAVIGPVGSGKSSFLMSLLNEIQVTSGRVSVKGSVAYALQESWIFNSTVQQNITFGKSYEIKRFKEVISVCAMNRDLKMFPFGERSLVGERGVTLSGGQKARITLARALYNNADIYLLDDPLSAVDSEVANHIFEKCITEYLKSKSVILVTHQIQFIKKAHKILVLREGRPLAVGSYTELMEAGIDFMSLIKTEEKSDNNVINKQQMNDVIISDNVFRQRAISRISSQSGHEANSGGDSDEKLADELKASGSVDARIYWEYIRSGAGSLLLVIGLISTLLAQGLENYSDIWLSEWINRDTNYNSNVTDNSDNSDKKVDESENIKIYSILLVTIFLSLILRSTTWFVMCIKASINLHNRIFYRLMRTRITFFDTNPVGRILNRFTKDMGTVDEKLPFVSYEVNKYIVLTLGLLTVVAISNYYLIIPAIGLLAAILAMRWIYLKTSRDLQRFEGIARSPLYNHMTTTLSGLITIRAYRAEQMFREQYYRYQNDHTSTYFMQFTASRCSAITMDFICVAYIVCVICFSLISYKDLASGTVGLIIFMALSLIGSTQYGIRLSAEMENQMTSVERIVEYSKLESEGLIDSEIPPPDEWPDKGCIELKHVYLTYDNLPKPTLHDLNCLINGGEKVGIVGRTGAGKSSILSALFRMHDIDGNIIIDGIDHKTIGLHDLRRHMSIIPQNPMAFIGSLRKNLDPFDEHSEDRLWEVLEEVQLKEAVMEMSGQLEYQLSESGGNLSVGQRQLICLARAILRRNRILVLDEATANVDHKTDALIQRTIRENFADCTVLTIAHRLNTIIDSDRVLVLDSGRIMEFGVPYELLQNNSGMLYKLVKQTGVQMADQLIRLAKQS
ncbi:ATP-binding cassette sub-family C member 4-like, partial [Oppia nitens]|uniref:ATP-binding cassette sub-family C member 4-like n=1 Tax=Oppia nitens TaxID=1686743 RepID=UPI0023DA3950